MPEYLLLSYSATQLQGVSVIVTMCLFCTISKILALVYALEAK